MSEDENFLTRWSRRKLEGEPATPAEKSPPPQAEKIVAPDAEMEKSEGAKADAPFDLASLPSLESITSETDIRVFLQKGVPADLTRAALRRAWAADPAIRNHVGPAEYAWDFTDPNAMPGFGGLGPEHNIKDMLAEVFGEVRKTAGADEPPSDRTTEQIAEPAPQSARTSDMMTEPAAEQVASGERSAPAGDAPSGQDHPAMVQRNDDIAAQRDDSENGMRGQKARRHGGALPHDSSDS